MYKKGHFWKTKTQSISNIVEVACMYIPMVLKVVYTLRIKYRDW
jgi:hypothetical protein